MRYLPLIFSVLLALPAFAGTIKHLPPRGVQSFSDIADLGCDATNKLVVWNNAGGYWECGPDGGGGGGGDSITVDTVAVVDADFDSVLSIGIDIHEDTPTSPANIGWDLDLTEINDETWGDASEAAITITYATSGGNAVFEVGAAYFSFDQDLRILGQSELHLFDSDSSQSFAFIPAADFTSNRTCQLVDGAAPIPDACVGDGTDGGGTPRLDEILAPTTTGSFIADEFDITWEWKNDDGSAINYFTFSFDHQAASEANIQNGVVIQRANSANSEDMEALLVIANLDLDGIVVDGIRFAGTGSAFTSAISTELMPAADTVLEVNGPTALSGTELALLDGITAALVDAGDSPNAAGEVSGTYTAGLTIDDGVTVDNWTMGDSAATTPAITDDDTSLATTAFHHEQEYIKCLNIDEPVTTDDDIAFFAIRDDITVTATGCHTYGVGSCTSSCVQINKADATVVDTPTCTSSNTITWDESITSANHSATGVFEVGVIDTDLTGSGGHLIVCMAYKLQD